MKHLDSHMQNGQETAKVQGLILEIQRMSTEDGPGLRSTVFMKGCSLSCSWCQNPESINPWPQLDWFDSSCIGCGTCIQTCPNGALSFAGDKLMATHELCTTCALCTEVCPSGALKLLGTQRGSEELARELEKDKAYYRTSEGGVTFSGGEPCLQPEFVAETLRSLKQSRIHTALDTSGMCSKDSLQMALFATDLVLFDLKIADPSIHQKYTRASNKKILENFRYLCSTVGQNTGPKEIHVRTPIIPRATDSKENILQIGELLRKHARGAVTRWELCAFNNLCRDKYTRLGLDWEFHDCELIEQSRMEELAETAGKSGVDPGIVIWSGGSGFEGRD